MGSTQWIIETPRLGLRQLGVDDAAFMHELLNDPAFLLHIGDRGVRSVEDARNYLLKGPIESYRRNGFGLWLVETLAGREAAGICGLVRRDGLDDIDVGFAFLPQHRSRGYAREATAAVLRHACDVLGLQRVVAITNPSNEASARVLESVGLRFERLVRLAPGEQPLRLFATAQA
jgi:[ribosomal protein S5]-alanine N-acetyltransferase